jgi:hypothetical protein
MKRVSIENRVIELSDKDYTEARKMLDAVAHITERGEWDGALAFMEKQGKFLFYLDGDYHY